MKKILLLLLFLAGLSAPMLGQGTDEKAGIDQLFSSQYGMSIASFERALKANPENAFAHYGIAQALLGFHQQQMSAESYRNKFKNFQPHFDWLKKAHAHAVQASTLYRKLPSNEQDRLRKAFSTTADQVTLHFMANLQEEAFSIINNAPYRKDIFMLYKSQVYDRVADADTVESLREILVGQCKQYQADYPNSIFLTRVEVCKRKLLMDYTNVKSIRQFGDRAGRGYENFCDLIIELYSAEELANIVPQFYGAEFGFDENTYTSHPNYKKLEDLAKTQGLTPISLLCQLNMHNTGCTDANKKLYDLFIRKFAPEDIAYIAVQRMAAPFIYKSDWKGAFEVFNTYKPLFPKDPRLAKVMAILKEPSGERQLKNLGNGVNTELNEYSPVLALDGKRLYFTRKLGETGEDIYESTKDPNGIWGMAIKLNREINTNTHEIPLSLSPKGDLMFIFGNYSKLKDFTHVNRTEAQLGKGDIYYAKRSGRNWTGLDAFTFPVNTTNYEEGLSMTSDGKAVFFASDREDAIGGYNPIYPENKLYFHGSGEFNLDLYVAVKQADGSWGKPINLGATINTPYAERKPFLHPDGKTLYFVSDGHDGLGGFDIFMSKRLREDSWTDWTTPTNIGKTLNSPLDDSFYITSMGTSALVVSAQKDSRGGTDIYEVSVPEKYRPEPVMVVSGEIKTVTGTPVETNIRWEEEGNKGNAGTIKSDKEDGQYQMQLKGGKKYVYFADHKDYFGTSVTVDLLNIENPKISDNTLEVSSFGKGESKAVPFIMKTLHFDHNSDRIREESFYDLKRLADMFKRHPLMKLRIEGHTDSDGNDAFNKDLSDRRAKAVREFLAKEGCAADKLTAFGFGEVRPKASNATEDGKQLNRRVEFYIE